MTLIEAAERAVVELHMAGSHELADSLRAALATGGWRPIAEMNSFEPEGVRIGNWIGSRWSVAPYNAYKRDAIPGCYTHFYRPALPAPPAVEVA